MSETARRWREKNADRLREYRSAYRLANRERQLARDAARYAADPEGERERIRRHRERHPEKVRAAGKKWRDANPEKVRASITEWRAKNPDMVKAHTKKRWRENAAEERAQTQAWRKANPDRVRETRLRWLQRNPEKRSLYEQRRKARRLSSPGRGVTTEDWLAVLDDSLGLCAYCGEPAERLTMDHIDPLSKQGAHDPDNLAAACRSCNASKGNRSLVVWLATRM